MAATTAMMNRHIVSTILHHLSDMKYKDRRQRGPDQPVELLEFRPTLVPAILVNKLWADAGTSVLWKRYPHLPALKFMDMERRQYYANKVHQIFSLSPPPGHPETLDYLDNLEWSSLKSLELEVDFIGHGAKFLNMLHPGLEHFELSGMQSGGATYFADVVLPSLFAKPRNLKSIRFGPGVFPDDDSVHAGTMFEHLDNVQSINTIEVKSAGFMSIDSLFTRLSQRAGLEALEIDLEPGIFLLPQLEGPNALPSPFSSLKRLDIMCYPEIALSLIGHLSALEELQLDICRIPEQPVQDSDFTIFDDLFAQLSSNCPHLRFFKLSVGALAFDFPSVSSFPRLTGSSLVTLAQHCPMLEVLNVFATEPSAIDGSGISSDEFDAFCKSLPQLQSLILKLLPSTASALAETALRSLGNHCHELNVLRLKIPFQLPYLPVSSLVPQILVSAPGTPALELDNGLQSAPHVCSLGVTEDSSRSLDDLSPISDITKSVEALFPRLTHLALARPETVLAIADDSFTASSASYSEIVDPELEEELVRSWAHALLTHFPRLEILEAWGDWAGQDNESLNYFLPTEEILASTWEYLSGAEQDLWDDDEEGEEDGSWPTYESGDDWDAASYLNEFTDVARPVLGPGEVEDEPEGMLTPGRTIDKDDFFEDASKKPGQQVSSGVPHTHDFDFGFDEPNPAVPVNGVRDTYLS